MATINTIRLIDGENTMNKTQKEILSQLTAFWQKHPHLRFAIDVLYARLHAERLCSARWKEVAKRYKEKSDNMETEGAELIRQTEIIKAYETIVDELREEIRLLKNDKIINESGVEMAKIDKESLYRQYRLLRAEGKSFSKSIWELSVHHGRAEQIIIRYLLEVEK